MRVRGAIVDGHRTTTRATLPVRAPFSREKLGEVPECGKTEVDQAVQAAVKAMRVAPLPAWERAAILDRAADRLSTREVAEPLARLVAVEVAKPIRQARAEVERAAVTFQFAAAACRSLAGDMVPLDASEAGQGRLGFTLRIPIGVVGAITPFNFPVNLVAHKIAPAIAAGCAVVLKPAHQAPLSGLTLAELLVDECGLPPGWLHAVTGSGHLAGERLVDHGDVPMITFTGSAAVGWGIRARVPKKKVSLELGNNAPVLIEADGDWPRAATRIAQAGFTHAGQSCVSVQRVLVHRAVAEDFVASLCEGVAALRVGDPLDESTDVSSVIDTGARQRITRMIDEAVAAGATVQVGGGADDANIVRPTVLADVTGDMRIVREEVFGPVVSVQTYSDVQEGIRLANDTVFGLQAGIFTSSLATARLAMNSLQFGGVIINDVPTWRADQMPYGGSGDSGNTREGPQYATQEMTEVRTIVLA